MLDDGKQNQFRYPNIFKIFLKSPRKIVFSSINVNKYNVFFYPSLKKHVGKVYPIKTL